MSTAIKNSLSLFLIELFTEIIQSGVIKVVKIMNAASSIPEKYFSYNVYGEYRPLIDVSTIDNFQKKKQARSYNRRVEIYLCLLYTSPSPRDS